VNKPDHRIKGLGEVSIRVRDLAAMCAFLRTSSGSRCSGREESFVFFEIAREIRWALAEPRPLRLQRADVIGVEIPAPQLGSVDACITSP
jgi:hypothetical protein